MEIIVSSLALLLILVIIYKILFTGHENLPPSPPSFPILGHLRLLTDPKVRPHIALQNLSDKYGPILFLRFGFRPVLLVSSPSLAEECLSKNDVVFANRPKTMKAEHDGLTTLGWSPYGDHWRNLRRFMSIQLFCNKSLDSSTPVREEETRFFIGQLFRSSDPSGEPISVDLFPMVNGLLNNVLTRLAFGKRCDIEPGLFKPGRSMCELDFLPFLRWIGYKGMERNMKKTQRKRYLFLQGKIDEFRRIRGTDVSNYNNNNNHGRKPIIETLLSLQDEEPYNYPDGVVRGILQLMFMAGADSVVQCTKVVMSLLLKHPEALEKVRSEINRLVGNKRLVDDSDFTKLLHLRRVIYESLRLYSAPLLVPHFSSQDCVVGGYHIPKGTMLLVNAWAIHRNPDLWENPSELIPERFTGMEGDRVGYKFIPFGAGRRGCPGIDMGLRMTVLVLGALIQCFHWDKSCSGPNSSDSNPEILYAPCPSMTDLLSQLSTLAV